MKKQSAKLLIILIFILFLPALLRAQPPYRLTVESGGSVDFKVYSLKYYNDGMNYDDFTTLRIYCDTLDSGDYTEVWYLGVKAQDSEFISTYPGQSLALDFVELQAADGPGEQSFGNELNTSKMTLSSSSYQSIVTGGDAGNYKIDLSYYLDSVKGQHPGYYNTNFIFRMDTVPISSW